MAFSAFLAALFDNGRVTVAHPQQALPAEELERAWHVLQQRAEDVALDFPGKPPAVDWPVALWAATALYRGCQLAIYRELDAGAIAELLADSCPTAEAASRHYSADLTLVFLPDLIRQATTAAAEDPLVARLKSLAAQWPLSSVGALQIEPAAEHVAEITAHPDLLRCYVDRILARKDWPRLADPAVRAATAAAIGSHVSLWPDAAKHLPTNQP